MKNNQIILIIIGVLILIGLVSSFSYWFQFVRPGEVFFTGGVDLCNEFPKVGGEISCREASVLALKNYPGKIIEIKKTILSFSVGKSPVAKTETETENRDIWLLKIHLKEPTLSLANKIPSLPIQGEILPKYSISEEEILVVVDRYQKIILSPTTIK